jgi:hypothetical protein
LKPAVGRMRLGLFEAAGVDLVHTQYDEKRLGV